MKLSHILLIALVLGVVVGYYAEPGVAPILQALVKKETKPVATRDEWDDLADENQPDTDVEEPKPEEPKPEDPKPEPDPEPVDGFVDGEEEGEEDDPDGVTPRKIKRYVGEDDGWRPVSEERFIGKLTGANWRQPAMLERRLAGNLRQALKKIDQKGVTEFLKKPENRLMLAQWELLHLSDMDGLSKLMKDRETAEDLALLLNDLPWISSFVYDGQLEKPEVALAMVRHFRQNDPNMDKDVLYEGGTENVGNTKPGLKRRIAAAVAVQFTRNGWYGDGREMTPEEIEELKILGNMGAPRTRGKKEKKDVFKAARERYMFFAESADKELLNSGFANLPDWLMHIVCGWKGDSGFGTANTMRWLRDNCSAPAMRYTGMAFQVPYLPLNVTGDVIFSDFYYQPFQSLYPDNFAKMTRDVGAVCGGLSHFGTSSACANGVPAVTMGEPGHCAYAVYADGKWHPSNTVSEDRHPHWKCWGKYPASWSAFEMMTNMFQNGARTRDAQMVATMASVLAAHKNPVNALKLYELSATMQPLNHPIWEMYMETASKYLKRQPRKWLGVNEFICSSVAPQHPAMCAEFLTDSIYPSMLATLRSPKQKIAAFEALFNNFNINEKAEWDMDKLLDMQYASLGKSRSLKKEFFEDLFDSVSKHPDFSLAIAWAIRTAYTENKNFGKQVLEQVEKAMENCTDKDLMVAGIIRGAEAVGNIELATRYSEPYVKKKEAEMKPLPKFEPVGGNLISEGGLVTLSKYHPEFRSAIYHGAALTTAGGHIHSDGGKHQTVTVELKKAAPLGGIVIIPTGGSAAGYYEWNLEVSKDGKEWTHLAKLPNNVNGPVRVHIKKNNPTAKFIRIDSGEGQLIGINFRALLVYDNKKVH